MRKKITSVSFLLVLIGVFSIGGMSCKTSKTDTAENSVKQMITVLNPALSTSMVERIPLTPRIATIEGKTIYLVDLQWGGPEAAYSVFEEMKGWFSRNIPSVNVEIRRSSGGPFGDDPELRKEIIAKNAAGVVVGIGG
jgi:hypothetical protein